MSSRYSPGFVPVQRLKAPLGQALSLFAMQAGMISLFTFSYLNVRDAKPVVHKA